MTQQRLKQLGIWLAIGFLFAGLIAEPGWSQSGSQSDSQSTSQSTSQSSPTDAAPSIVLSEPNAGANRLLPGPLSVTAEEVAIAPIYLDGRTLFYVSAPQVEGQSPAEERAQEIQERLYELARSQTTTPLSVQVEIDQPSNLPVIVASPTETPQAEQQTLLTVTQLDAQVAGYADAQDRAQAIAREIQTALGRYIAERQPQFWQQQTKTAAAIIGVAVLLQLVANRIGLRLKRRQQRLTSVKTQLGEARSHWPNPLVEVFSTGSFNTVFEQVKARLDNRQKRKLNELLQGLLTIFQVGLWIGVPFWILALFPYSRWLTTLSRIWIRVPAQVLLTLGLAYTALRISSFAIDKTILTLQEGTRWGPEKSKRLSLRFSTFSQVAKGIAGLVIFSFAVLRILAIVGVQVGPLLAGAGIIGVGISLAAQSLIKDFINGFFILFEDQFGVGDVITVGNLSGSVESLNLRITQLRDSEGRLITIPNSQISIVQNASKDWAQVDLSIRIAPSADLLKAIALIKQTAIALSEDPQWQRSILEPPDILGVESLDSTGIAIRLFMKTQPLQQWSVARELRARVKQVLDEAKIIMGVPQERVEIRLSEATKEIAQDAIKDITNPAESRLPESPT